MLVLAYVTFLVLCCLCAMAELFLYRLLKRPNIGHNPTFLRFQNSYFAAYLLAMLADWLQRPYMYKLYSYYGFEQDQIAVLYVAGFASNVLLGTWAPIATDHFGRRKMCIFFTLIYTLTCFMKISREYGILLIARLLEGVATSLLFYSFEAWYTHEHLERHDFPREWIPLTAVKAENWNSILAAGAGLFSAVVADWLRLEPIAPFMFSVPLLLLSGIAVMAFWGENYGSMKIKFGKSCMEGLRLILTKEQVFLIGSVEALFESVLYIIIFLWTPILDLPTNPLSPHSATSAVPLGLIFSSFMMSTIIGTAVFCALKKYGVHSQHLLAGAVSLMLLANLALVAATHPDHVDTRAAFFAFLVAMFAVGLYFPSMGNIRLHVLPDPHRVAIMNWFRVPLNLIACVVLMLLHNDAFRHGNRLIFMVGSALLLAAMFCVIRFLNVLSIDMDSPVYQTADEDTRQLVTQTSS